MTYAAGRSWLLLIVATLAAIAGVLAGVLYSASPRRIRFAIPLSAGLLAGVALFGLAPEAAEDIRWPFALLFVACGFAVLLAVDRAVHGLAAPVVLAASLHATLDGWAIGAAGAGSAAIQIALPLAIVLHKGPEGLALGGLLGPAVPARGRAILIGCAAECMTIAGGVIAIGATSLRAGYGLAVAAGFFLFLAWHGVYAEWRRAPRAVWLPALAGLAVSLAIQAALRFVFGFSL